MEIETSGVGQVQRSFLPDQLIGVALGAACGIGAVMASSASAGDWQLAWGAGAGGVAGWVLAGIALRYPRVLLAAVVVVWAWGAFCAYGELSDLYRWFTSPDSKLRRLYLWGVELGFRVGVPSWLLLMRVAYLTLRQRKWSSGAIALLPLALGFGAWLTAQALIARGW